MKSDGEKAACLADERGHAKVEPMGEQKDFVGAERWAFLKEPTNAVVRLVYRMVHERVAESENHWESEMVESTESQMVMQMVVQSECPMV